MPTFCWMEQVSLSERHSHIQTHDLYCDVKWLTVVLYSNWKWPDVDDLHAFEGDLIHTANWPEDFDAAGKVVAVIGNGSTGIQVVPELQKSKHFFCYSAKQARLTVYQRSRSCTMFSERQLGSLRHG